jgi:hypothetical protein
MDEERSKKIFVGLVGVTGVVVCLATIFLCTNTLGSIIPHPLYSSPPPPTPPLIRSIWCLGLVVLVFLIDILVLWLLRKMGADLNTTVKVTFKKFGGNVVIISAGLVGVFLGIAMVAFAALFILTRLF